jgi:hypothetical protein
MVAVGSHISHGAGRAAGRLFAEEAHLATEVPMNLPFGGSCERAEKEC